MVKYLQIATVLQKNYAISQEDAIKIYPELVAALTNHFKLQLSFEGLENCSTIFLRHTLGNLYLTYGADVDSAIQIVGLNPDDEVLPHQLKRLKERALNPQVYKPIFDQAFGEA